MIDKTKIHDISVALGAESIDYPGDTPYSSSFLATIKDGAPSTLSSLSLSAHSGTHLDAPAHFIPDGKTIDQYEAGDFILPALVVDFCGKEFVSEQDLAGIPINPGDALLFKTDNSFSGRCRSGVFSEDYVYIDKGAARLCAEKGASLVGLDYITIERFGDDSFEAHKVLLEADALVLEGINLSNVKSGQYTLFCAPLKLMGVEASPARALLLG